MRWMSKSTEKLELVTVVENEWNRRKKLDIKFRRETVVTEFDRTRSDVVLILLLQTWPDDTCQENGLYGTGRFFLNLKSGDFTDKQYGTYEIYTSETDLQEGTRDDRPNGKFLDDYITEEIM